MAPEPADISTTPLPHARHALIEWLSGPWPISLLLSLFLMLGASAAQQKTPTYDEPIHITGGDSYWKYNDYRMQPENGNWSQRFVALPVWLAGFKLPTTNDPGWKGGNVWAFAHIFFFGQGNNAHSIIRFGRMMQLISAAALAILVYLWSGKLFGPLGGVIGLTLCACSPTILGYGFLATSDMGATLFLLAATWAVWTLLHRVTFGTIAIAGFALSGAALAKFSGLAILPISLVLVCARLTNLAPWTVAISGTREVRGRGRQLLLMAALAALLTTFVVLMIWASFGFRYSIFGPAATAEDRLATPWESLDLGSGLLARLIAFSREKHLLPEGYLYGLSYMRSTTQSRHSFLNGTFNTTGFRSFFAYCLALKTPLTLFLLLLLSAVGGWTQRKKSPRDGAASPGCSGGLYELAPVLTLLAVYLAFAFSSNLNIGHRHIMPIYPALFILAGGAAVWFRRDAATGDAATSEAKHEAPSPSNEAENSAGTPRIARAVILGALLISVGQALWIWPNYLAYFNILGGGQRHGYRHLVDSSLDWGQDLGGLVKWLDAHPAETADRNRVFVSYLGSVDVKYYGLRARILPPYGLVGRQEEFQCTGGVYCISATKLQSLYSPFPGRWTSEYEEMYQRVRPAAKAYLAMQNDPAARQSLVEQAGEQQLLNLLDNYNHLRFARLCAYLRAREPDDNVGGSILIFRLTDADVNDALEGPPPAETLPRPQH